MKKKALAMALGAMMAAGTASQATAASMVDFSGYYRAYYASETNLGRQAADRGFTDSYFANRLNLEIDFTPTDEISVHWRLRAPNFQRWGNGGQTNVVTDYVYGKIKQDWGTIYVGKLAGGFDEFGLSSLGYTPSTDPVYTTTGPFENSDAADGIRYANSWDNGWSLIVQYNRLDTPDYALPSAGNDYWGSDHNYDRFIIEPRYEWENGGASLGLSYERRADYTVPGYDAAAPAGKRWGSYTYANAMNAFYVNPAIMHSFGDVSVHFEGKFGWAKIKDATSTVVNGARVNKDLKSDGAGVYLDVDYNYGPGNVTLAGWWVRGTAFGDDKSHSLVDMGGNFYPLVVAYSGTASGNGRVGAYNFAVDHNTGHAYVGGEINDADADAIAIANNGAANFIIGPGGLTTAADMLNVISYAGTNPGNINAALPNNASLVYRSGNEGTKANHWAVALTGKHAFTDEVSMHYGLAYLAMNKPSYQMMDRAVVNGANIIETGYMNQDKDLGWEIDLGVELKLLDNLTFTSTFGYMFSGDAYKTLKGYHVSAADAVSGNRAVNAVWEDPKDAYTWYNVLQFNF